MIDAQIKAMCAGSRREREEDLLLILQRITKLIDATARLKQAILEARIKRP